MDPNIYPPTQPERPNQYQAVPPSPPLQPPLPPQPPLPLSPQKRSKRTKVALWLMIGPTALFVFALIVGIAVPALTNSARQSSAANCTTTQTTQSEAATSLFGENTNNNTASSNTDCQLFGESSPLETASSIFVFLSGAIVILTWLPGMIIGIVLLATRPKLTA